MIIKLHLHMYIHIQFIQKLYKDNSNNNINSKKLHIM